MAELSEILEAGPVLISLPGDPPMIVVGAWGFQVENGLAWAVPGFSMTPGQAIHFVEGTMEQTGAREWTWTAADGRGEFELTSSRPPFSVDLDAQVESWLAYRTRNPVGTSREDARKLLEEQLHGIDNNGRILI